VYAPRLNNRINEEEGMEEEVEGEMTGDLMRIAAVAGLGGTSALPFGTIVC